METYSKTARRPLRGSRNRNTNRYSPEAEAPRSGAKLRVDNLHYDLTEDDLEDLFTRIGPILSVSLRYDRAGRSDGTAFVTYEFLSDARLAIRQFDGANAKGQPIRLTLMPTAPAAKPAGRNPFDTAQKPGRSLFERIEAPSNARTRSASPGRPRPTDTTKAPPEGIDRYVPGQRSRSPASRRAREDRGGGRRPGARREESGRGRATVNGRPRKTQEELDAEMEDYWGGKRGDEGVEGKGGVVPNGNLDVEQSDAAVVPVVVDDGDIEMIE
ncbi:MAG: hypothetical protein M1830_000466 [Pleopsidium flavum]|nr:MAG: hypothetical protein M1830_000466 [Pleopsidium flavum]